jgi:TPR repeat protein
MLIGAGPNGNTHAFAVTGEMNRQSASQLQNQAQAGDVGAELRLAYAYEEGKGVPRDERIALSWYRKAAESGNAAAQNRLGEMYRGGVGVPENKQAAVRWWHEAARQGNADAMWNLGTAYYNGDGVRIDDSVSYAWFLVAGETGYERAAAAIQRAKAELRPPVLANGYKQLAEMYDGGEYLPKNEAAAARWWLKAGATGDADAQQMGIATNYRFGLGIPENDGKARKLYERIAASGYSPALRDLAPMDATGQGGKTNQVEACVLYARLVAQEDDPQALRSLAKLKGEMRDQDWKKVEKKVRSFRIDPQKLDVLLQRTNLAK